MGVCSNFVLKKPFRFSLADANADGRWGQSANGGADGYISLTNFSTPIFGIIMIGFRTRI
jgi:hypothetical protein